MTQGLSQLDYLTVHSQGSEAEEKIIPLQQLALGVLRRTRAEKAGGEKICIC